MKERYRTVWEIKQKDLIDMAADRAPFVDQTQSMNCYIANPTMHQLTSMHMYSHSNHLKTVLYYLRTKGAIAAKQFTVEKDKIACSLDKGCSDCSA